jgi:hypothetical protein
MAVPRPASQRVARVRLYRRPTPPFFSVSAPRAGGAATVGLQGPTPSHPAALLHYVDS